MLDYAALAALAAVASEGSFERAAQCLHVTPSAVSQRVRLLEERMGCALVVRAQPCRPTETGRRLCHHLDRVRLLEQELQQALPGLSPAGGALRVRLPVAVNADSLATWFAPMLAEFAADAPVLVDLSVDDQDHTGEWLRSGAVLAAVTASGRPFAGCHSHPLGAMRYRAAASPAFLARHFADGASAASLASAPCLVFNAKDELQDRWALRLTQAPVDLPKHHVPSPQAFVTAALAGMGWGLQPEALVSEHLRAGRLVELLPGAVLDVPLYWQHARAASGLLEAFSRRVVSAAGAALVMG
ncbi:MAG TPA: LysR family transcriptional regulator ArgP [Alicycliphilus sp.]|nr:LysR family transcriptional regulator ArgP [Alicycliphilus sp.]